MGNLNLFFCWSAPFLLKDRTKKKGKTKKQRTKK